jgi:hypothetical protein
VTGTCGLRGDLVTMDGAEYMKVRQVQLLPEVGDMTVYASNLFTGSDELSEYTCPQHDRRTSSVRARTVSLFPASLLFLSTSFVPVSSIPLVSLYFLFSELWPSGYGAVWINRYDHCFDSSPSIIRIIKSGE